MNRRSFITALAGLPIVGFGARAFGRTKPTAKKGITVHGPEEIVVKRWWPALETLPLSAIGESTLSLRFENVPLREDKSARELVNRLGPLFGTINKSDWHCYWGTERAGTLMFTDWGESSRESGHCCIICAFRSASTVPPWPGSHRPVDFETEILKALTKV